MVNNCPFLTTTGCSIIKEITSGIDYIPNKSACNFCTNKCEPPRAINQVTTNLAISISPKDKSEKLIKKYYYFISGYEISRLKNILDGNGVGSQLWKLLESLDIKHNINCPCLDWAERMNNWGPDGCRIIRKEIVEHMKASANNYGWGNITIAIAKSITTGLAFKINPLDIYGSLLDEAIRLAEIEEKIIPLEDNALKGNL